MSADLLFAFSVFAIVSAITPGPNNVMLMASGVNHGVRPTLPHVAGVHLGFTFMLVLVGFGLGSVFSAYPAIYTVMKVVGAVYMLWLALKIAGSGSPREGEHARAPMSFLEGAAFQWINPKAWAMVIGAIAAYTDPERFGASMLAITLVYFIVGAPCSLLWVGFGAGLRRFLSDPRKLRLFNWVMAALLIASLMPVGLDLLHLIGIL